MDRRVTRTALQRTGALRPAHAPAQLIAAAAAAANAEDERVRCCRCGSRHAQWPECAAAAQASSRTPHTATPAAAAAAIRPMSQATSSHTSLTHSERQRRSRSPAMGVAAGGAHVRPCVRAHARALVRAPSPELLVSDHRQYLSSPPVKFILPTTRRPRSLSHLFLLSYDRRRPSFT